MWALIGPFSDARLSAHAFSVSYAHVNVMESRIVATIRMPLDDVDLLLRLDRDIDGAVTEQELADAAPALERYLNDRFRLSADGAMLGASIERTARWADSVGFPYVEVVLAYQPPPSADRLAIGSTVLTDLYPDHRTIAEIARGDRREHVVFQHANTFESARAPGSWWESGRTFLVLGIEHIVTGYDHLLFLVALLVAGRGMRQLVAIVTSFTIAHSLTLGIATFGWIEPPARLVEAAIALSIAYVGIENLVVRDVRGRWRLTFAFGLVHGFGFANVLREMDLARAALASSLFTFNLGVEIGQLAVLLVLWPILRAIQRSTYAGPITRWVSATVTVFGAVWFVQRIG